jgi:PAS domain S-box-containing protein
LLAKQGQVLMQVSSLAALQMALEQFYPALLLIEEPDPVLLLSACQQARAWAAHLPIVPVLPAGQTPDLAALDPYVADYLRQPFAPQELLARVRGGLAQGLRESKYNETLLKSIFEGINFNVFVIEVIGDHDFVVSAVNPAHTQNTGLPAEALRYKRIDDLAQEGTLTPEAAATIKARYQQCTTSGQVLVYEETIELHGQTSHWLTHLAPMVNAQGRVYRIIGSSINISLHKKTEMQLRETQNRFQLLTDNIPGLLFQYLARADGTGTMIYLSPGLTKVSDSNAESMANMNMADWLARIHPDDRAQVDASAAQARTSGKPWHADFRVMGSAGKDKWVRVAVQPIVQPNGDCQWNGLVLNITENKELVEEIQRQYYILKGIYESVPSSIFSIDTHYHYTSFNQAHYNSIKRLYGVDIQLGQNAMEGFGGHAERQHIAHQNLDLALAGQTVTASGFYGREGRPQRFIEVTHNPILDQQGPHPPQTGRGAAGKQRTRAPRKERTAPVHFGKSQGHYHILARHPLLLQGIHHLAL